MRAMQTKAVRMAGAGLLAGVLCAAAAPAWAAVAGWQDPALRGKAESAIDRGLRWLRSAQKPDGSWAGNLGVTAMALTAFARSPRAYREDDGPFMRNAIAHIRAAVKPDGSITHGGGYEMYTTALSVLALQALKDPKNDPIIQNALKWMKGQQTTEEQGYRPEDKLYGGFGYGSTLRPDLSNTQYAIEALRMSGIPANDPAFAKAVKFITRVQNRTESNDVPGALDDGGFAYLPGFSFAGGFTSTGSMTLAGVKSFLWADVDKNDPRVQAALKWLSKTYTLDENPGLGPQGYYYYIDLFSRTWALLGTDVVTTADGAKHDWYRDLVAKLLADQRPEGFWVNGRSGRWWEDRPELSTAHALLALIYGLELRSK